MAVNDSSASTSMRRGPRPSRCARASSGESQSPSTSAFKRLPEASSQGSNSALAAAICASTDAFASDAKASLSSARRTGSASTHSFQLTKPPAMRHTFASSNPNTSKRTVASKAQRPMRSACCETRTILRPSQYSFATCGATTSGSVINCKKDTRVAPRTREPSLSCSSRVSTNKHDFILIKTATSLGLMAGTSSGFVFWEKSLELSHFCKAPLNFALLASNGTGFGLALFVPLPFSDAAAAAVAAAGKLVRSRRGVSSLAGAALAFAAAPFALGRPFALAVAFFWGRFALFARPCS
mmetsp:Transcript_38412/g.96408  ORF Transcript_38412/g.96408 Transcript_38412/m.96408 type:complete len:297 (+) Transcript_38412:740-1630(+)